MPLTEEDWLRQITADRDNDELRLVFADWLEEQGDSARAEFIRVQILLAAMPADDSAERETLFERQMALLEAHGDAWLAKMPKVLRPGCLFVRGFMADLDCLTARWLRYGKRVQQAYPLLQALTLNSGRFGRRNKFLVSPFLAQLTSLAIIKNPIGDKGATALATSLHISRLTDLTLWGCNINVRGALALSASPYLTRLNTLMLRSNLLFDAGATALASAPHLAQLTLLDLADNCIGDAGAAALADSPHLAQLTTLRLENNLIGEAGVEALRERFGNAVVI